VTIDPIFGLGSKANILAIYSGTSIFRHNNAIALWEEPMRFTRQKKAVRSLKQRMTSIATRRKRLNANIRKKILWRQRSYIVAASIVSWSVTRFTREHHHDKTNTAKPDIMPGFVVYERY